MSRRRPKQTSPPYGYTVAFVCTGFGSHPRRPLALWSMIRHPNGNLTAVAWRGTDETRPIPWGTTTREPWRRTVNCRTCPAHREYPEERAFELAREAIGDGSRRNVDVDICYRP
jgi:hypothetical protein